MNIIQSRNILPCILFAGVMSLVVSLEQAKATSAPSADPALYELLQKFHGHTCAGSLFGARLGLAAKQALKDAGGTGNFTARYYDLSCPVTASSLLPALPTATRN